MEMPLNNIINNQELFLSCSVTKAKGKFPNARGSQEGAGVFWPMLRSTERGNDPGKRQNPRVLRRNHGENGMEAVWGEVTPTRCR